MFPRYGSVEYVLRRRGEFLTNIHQDPDPLLISDAKGICLSEKNQEENLWVRGNGLVHNYIDGACLFKSNPFENPSRYEGIEELIQISNSTQTK